jgi:hypothetical protein
MGFQRESKPIEKTNLCENPFFDLKAAMITFVSMTTLIIEKASLSYSILRGQNGIEPRPERNQRPLALWNPLDIPLGPPSPAS